jgi:F-type H+-transporting ATPase subunit delta
MTGAVAKRYARALLSVASEQGRMEEIATEIAKTAEWLEDPELAHAFASPVLGTSARRGLIGEITRALELSELTRNFLSLLAENKRLGEFRAITRAYLRMVDRRSGRVQAKIRSALPLTDSSLAEVVASLETLAGKKVVAQTEIDPALIAGLTVEMEGRVYDGSARTQLAHLAHTMAREGSPD